jgi:hypothetical protein
MAHAEAALMIAQANRRQPLQIFPHDAHLQA